MQNKHWVAGSKLCGQGGKSILKNVWEPIVTTNGGKQFCLQAPLSLREIHLFFQFSRHYRDIAHLQKSSQSRWPALKFFLRKKWGVCEFDGFRQ